MQEGFTKKKQNFGKLKNFLSEAFDKINNKSKNYE